MFWLWRGRQRYWLRHEVSDNTQVYADWVKTQNFTGRELIGAGLGNFKVEGNPRAGLYIRFKGRLMFPIENDYGDIIGFSGRKLHEDAPGGKYINSPETAIFDKSRTIFALGKAKTSRAFVREGYALLCEGQIDAIACHQAGLECAVAPLGTAFTSDQAKLLNRYTDRVVLCYDGDAAGQKAAARAYQELAAFGLQVSAVSLPEGTDPDDYISEHGIDAFRQLITDALPFLDYFVKFKKQTSDLSQPDQLSSLSNELAVILACIPDQVNREASTDHPLNKSSTEATIGPKATISKVKIPHPSQANRLNFTPISANSVNSPSPSSKPMNGSTNS